MILHYPTISWFFRTISLFLCPKSYFIVFNFTMKSLPIIIFYFRWRLLEDSLTFQLSTLERRNNENLDPRKKRPISKMSINDVLSLNFKSSMYVINIVKKKISKGKIVFPSIYSSFTLISTLTFHFQQLNSKNKILSRDGYWRKFTKKLFKK